jgi:hypothetical protein
MKNSYIIKFFCIFVVFMTFLPFSAAGSVNISISPIHGGTTLQLSAADVLSQTGREVRVRLTSTDGMQYQVFQRWIQPLTSSTGSLPGRDALKFYARSGSNGSGTLYGNVPEYVGMSDQLIYSSSANGLSDNFVLVYQVDPDRLNSSGQLMGRLLITVRPMGAGSSQDAFLDVLIDADLGFDVSIRGQKGTQVIRLGSQYADTRDQINVSFKGNVGPIRIYQELLSPIVLRTDQSELPRGALQYSALGGSEGLQFSDHQDVDFSRVLIYKSTLQQDQWELNYALAQDRFSMIKAGTYQGRIRYSIESSTFQKYFDFDIEIDITPIFEISFNFPDGPIDFSKIFPGSGAQERSVIVQVKSNLHQPYSVSQKVLDGLRNQKGETLSNEYFFVRTLASGNTAGELKFSEFEPIVTTSDQTLFVSDRYGSPVEFKVVYRLVPYDDMSPGNYRTEIIYSLGQI